MAVTLEVSLGVRLLCADEFLLLVSCLECFYFDLP